MAKLKELLGEDFCDGVDEQFKKLKGIKLKTPELEDARVVLREVSRDA